MINTSETFHDLPSYIFEGMKIHKFDKYPAVSLGAYMTFITKVEVASLEDLLHEIEVIKKHGTILDGFPQYRAKGIEGNPTDYVVLQPKKYMGKYMVYRSQTLDIDKYVTYFAFAPSSLFLKYQ